jgi:hypothetical protein
MVAAELDCTTVGDDMCLLSACQVIIAFHAHFQ